MRFRPLTIDGAWEVSLEPRQDVRGYFMRTYDDELFAASGIARRWLQENESWSRRRGTLRGLHFQKPPATEAKLVRAAAGAILDVIVDLRRSSPTFGRHAAVEISSSSHNSVFVPRGCAHGFCTLQDDTVVLYKVDAVYTPATEGGLRWDDPDLALPWPDFVATVSERDSRQPSWREFMMNNPFD